MKFVLKSLILLFSFCLSSCNPAYLFPLCGGSSDASVLIITDKKELDEKLLKDIFLLDDNALEKRQFKDQRDFIETMKRNGLICDKDNVCRLFYNKYEEYEANPLKEKEFYGKIIDVSIIYNQFFNNISLEEKFYFHNLSKNRKNFLELSKAYQNYVSDLTRRHIIEKILPIKINKENLHYFYFKDSRTSCERNADGLKTDQLEQNFNILLKGIKNGISK